MTIITPMLNFQIPEAGDLNWHATLAAGFDSAEARAYIVNDNDPYVTATVGDYIGQRYFANLQKAWHTWNGTIWLRDIPFGTVCFIDRRGYTMHLRNFSSGPYPDEFYPMYHSGWVLANGVSHIRNSTEPAWTTPNLNSPVGAAPGFLGAADLTQVDNTGGATYYYLTEDDLPAVTLDLAEHTPTVAEHIHEIGRINKHLNFKWNEEDFSGNTIGRMNWFKDSGDGPFLGKTWYDTLADPAEDISHTHTVSFGPPAPYYIQKTIDNQPPSYTIEAFIKL